MPKPYFGLERYCGERNLSTEEELVNRRA